MSLLFSQVGHVVFVSLFSVHSWPFVHLAGKKDQRSIDRDCLFVSFFYI